jgi:hypothetical protein
MKKLTSAHAAFLGLGLAVVLAAPMASGAPVVSDKDKKVAPAPAPAPAPAASQDWRALPVIANEVAGDAARAWINSAQIRGARCEGPIAILPQGSLRGGAPMGEEIERKLAGRVSPAVAHGIGVTISRAWAGWANAWETRIPTAFPQFAAFPLPAAPAHPTLPHPFRLATSSGEGGLSAPALTLALKHEIGPSSNEPGADGAIAAFAAAFAGRFHAWNAAALLVNLYGGGPSKLAPLPGPIFGTVQGDHVLGGPHQF